MLRSARRVLQPKLGQFSSLTRTLAIPLTHHIQLPLTRANYTTEAPQQAKRTRAPTSLSNTSRSFGEAPKHQLRIINKKFADDGKLLIMDISDRAITKLNNIAQEENNPGVALRISVESGGCHGFQYNLNLSDVNTKTDEDCVFEKGGAKVIIDDSSLGILRESTVDYTTELIGSMFKVVDSPYMASSCGCGSSFDFDFSKL
ncbi:CYFA0S11e01662g1_1 [Cyberlindnera fabianii]|uniref:CYFA0S11e01662g1_1 n=1 Tax=Cyberlindnera fabianii TaxID=36022 RepID=A0A061B8I7_CYBFA|nr:CYFA0S11e01662g1_1 [Cyberlindnera fabianii]